jgi:hypothetical protein
MSDSFILNFLYRETSQEISCRLRKSTYTYQFLCTIGKYELIVEKDDEGNLRAVDADPFSSGKTKPDPGLVRAIIAEMERILQ